ncbi:hypothetical protein R6Q59_019315 [Mikania micrantha]
MEVCLPLELRTAAMALIRHGPRMPPHRRDELKQVVKKYYGGREISEEDLEKALLVGMSPHEKRRLQKKRGISLNNTSSKNIVSEMDIKGNNVDPAINKNEAYEPENGWHGPHGKQVVDYLLKNHGENGIQEFCQRWRQVFVESINPRFLPAGWDVAHSGRREFGEFSVYNPANRAFVAAEDQGKQHPAVV